MIFKHALPTRSAPWPRWWPCSSRGWPGASWWSVPLPLPGLGQAMVEAPGRQTVTSQVVRRCP
ncbi:hypothetical protein QJS66_10530 [Kocuria rhizophila]|nr:hypothetical protein QJS66_10530 [Kocuria rhizophila]